MNRKTLLASIAAISMAAVPAAAFAKSQAEQPAVASSAGEKKICKTFASTESRMKSTRLCMTKAEWKKFDSEK